MTFPKYADPQVRTLLHILIHHPRVPENFDRFFTIQRMIREGLVEVVELGSGERLNVTKSTVAEAYLESVSSDLTTDVIDRGHKWNPDDIIWTSADEVGPDKFDPKWTFRFHMMARFYDSHMREKGIRYNRQDLNRLGVPYALSDALFLFPTDMSEEEKERVNSAWRTQVLCNLIDFPLEETYWKTLQYLRNKRTQTSVRTWLSESGIRAELGLYLLRLAGMTKPAFGEVAEICKRDLKPLHDYWYEVIKSKEVSDADKQK